MPEEIFSRDPGVMGGELVFAGTRVPVQALVDYLKAGHPLETFLGDFPTVSREQAVAFLGWALDAARRRASGEEFVARVEEDGGTVPERREDVIGRLKAGFASVPKSRVLSEELIAERREEAARREGEEEDAEGFGGAGGVQEG